MLEKVSTRVLGVVENMSGFVCPDCGNLHKIFGEGAAKQLNNRKGLSLIGEIPLSMPIREGADNGNPIVLNSANETGREAYLFVKDAILHEIRSDLSK